VNAYFHVANGQKIHGVFVLKEKLKYTEEIEKNHVGIIYRKK